jgi:hypothetical protein
MGIHKCAPIRFTIAFEGNVNSVNTNAYTKVPVLTESLVKPRSAARLSEIAFAMIRKDD